MSVANIIKLGPIVFNLASSTWTLAGSTTTNVNPTDREFSEMAAGQVSPSYFGIMTSEPVISTTFYDIALAISNGFNAAAPVPIGSAWTIQSVDVYGTTVQNQGTNASGSVHFKWTINNGLAILKSTTGRTSQTASGVIEIHAASTDGTTSPLALTSAVALPAIPVLTECFTLGQLEIAGSAITDLQTMDLDMGYSIKKERSGSDIFPTYIYADKIEPKITVGLNDATQMSTYTVLGTALGSSSFVGYYQKLANAGTRVSAGTAAHVKIAGSASQGMIVPDQSSLQPGSGEFRFTIHPIVGSNPVLALSKAAIT